MIPAPITGQEHLMRQWLTAEAERVVQLINWSIYTPDDARHELRAWARRCARLARITINPDRFADDLLAEEYDRQDAIYAETMAQLIQLAVRAFHRGGTPDDARAVLGEAACTKTLPPPVALLEQAMHHAITEHRRITRWRARMEAMTA